ncbi:expressed unknown protein [Seminavis robusta]|uniref:Uncharacterized protein n=1 Tax=Seminavis robusta TaxID=568900 RepID=A0A9N8DAG8_9STRA|nr:expressed unknown protein [Seminavis robusta]|eukprot:Sro57_g033360.1 n/a (309) ;mRNA; f:74989-77114
MTDEELMNSMEPFSEYVQDFQTVPAKLKKAPTTKGKSKKKGQNRRGWGAWATRRWQQEGYGRQSKQRNVPGRNRKGRRVVFDEKVKCIVHHKPSAERKLTTRNCNTIYRKVEYHRGIVECAVKANGGELLNCFPGLKQAEWRKIRDEVAAARVDFMLYNLMALLWRVPLFLIGCSQWSSNADAASGHQKQMQPVVIKSRPPLGAELLTPFSLCILTHSSIYCLQASTWSDNLLTTCLFLPQPHPFFNLLLAGHHLVTAQHNQHKSWPGTQGFHLEMTQHTSPGQAQGFHLEMTQHTQVLARHKDSTWK